MGGGDTMCIYFTAIGHLKAIDSKISLHLPNTEHLFLSKFCYWTKFFVFLPPMILCIFKGCAKKKIHNTIVLTVTVSKQAINFVHCFIFKTCFSI